MGIAIIGAGGLLRKILPDIRRVEPDVIAVSENPAEAGAEVAGLTVLPRAALDRAEHAERAICLAVGDGAVRRRLDAELRADGRRFASVRAPTALADPDARIGQGLILCSFALIEPGARIGRHFQCNVYASVGHDGIVGDYVTFGPRVGCSGHVEIGDGVQIGAGALIRNGRPDRPLRIGAGAVVGMGAVVMRDVPPGVTVIGNPARPIRETLRRSRTETARAPRPRRNGSGPPSAPEPGSGPGTRGD